MYKTDAVEPEDPALPVLTCYHDRKPSLEAVSSNCLVSHRKGHQLHSPCFLMKTQLRAASTAVWETAVVPFRCQPRQ